MREEEARGRTTDLNAAAGNSGLRRRGYGPYRKCNKQEAGGGRQRLPVETWVFAGRMAIVRALRGGGYG